MPPRTSPSRKHLPLGSLTQPSDRRGGVCEACGSERVTRIAMALTDGTPVQFSSCRSCEYRVWRGQRDDAALPVTAVLDRARKPPRVRVG